MPSSSFFESTAAIFTGDGTGVFTASEVAIPVDAVFARFFDANEDGRADLLTGGELGVIAAVVGGGAVGFPAWDPPLATDVSRFATGDLDGDEFADLVALNEAATEVRVWMSPGRFGFGSPQVLPFAAALVPHVALRDLDGDGHHDLVLGLDEGASLGVIRISDGAGGLGPEQSLALDRQFLLLADLDLDGVLDLVTGFSNLGTSPTGLRVQLGLGDGTFGPVVYTLASGSNLSNLVAGDVTGDGLPDLVFNDTGFLPPFLRVGALAGDGTGGFGPLQVLPDNVQVPRMIDIDGDGDLELFLSTAEIAVAPDASLGPFTGLVIPFGTFVDLDGDGDPDVLGDTLDGRTGWYRNDGGAFEFAASNLLLGSEVAIGDFDGDGIPDVVGLKEEAAESSLRLYTNLLGE